MNYLRLLLLALIFPWNARTQSVVVDVTNRAPVDLPVATVEVPWPEIRQLFEGAARDSVGVFLADTQLVSQIIGEGGNDKAGVLIFQSGFMQDETKSFVVRKAAAKLHAGAVTDAKYILPRKDVAWENDRIAFRIYGGPLAGDVLNGLDVWTKKVKYHIIDKWYHGDSLRGKERVSYHVDHGEGADLFLVGRSLGAGGSARWIDGRLDQAGMFSSYKIIATGPIRCMFSVTYRRDSAQDSPVIEEKIYTLDAGMNLNKIEVRYPRGADSSAPTAAGLAKRARTKAKGDAGDGWLSLWGATDADTANGFLGTGIVVPPPSTCTVMEDSLQHIIVGTPDAPAHFTYYAGAGWTKSGDFPTEESWENYLAGTALSLRNPLQVTISIRKR